MKRNKLNQQKSKRAKVKCKNERNFVKETDYDVRVYAQQMNHIRGQQSYDLFPTTFRRNYRQSKQKMRIFPSSLNARAKWIDISCRTGIKCTPVLSLSTFLYAQPSYSKFAQQMYEIGINSLFRLQTNKLGSKSTTDFRAHHSRRYKNLQIKRFNKFQLYIMLSMALKSEQSYLTATIPCALRETKTKNVRDNWTREGKKI